MHNIFRAFKYLKASLPFLKSFRRAYKQTTNNKGNESNDGSFFDKYFSTFLSNNNLQVAKMTESEAKQILNIQKGEEEQLEGKQVLERYYTLFKKNDNKIGGSAYLQSKVYWSKEILMSRFPNAVEIQEAFYKEVVEPEEKAEAEELAAKKLEEDDLKTTQQSKKKKSEEKKE